jgi:hypothetical protein
MKHHKHPLSFAYYAFMSALCVAYAATAWGAL